MKLKVQQNVSSPKIILHQYPVAVQQLHTRGRAGSHYQAPLDPRRRCGTRPTRCSLRPGLPDLQSHFCSTAPRLGVYEWHLWR
ncbi:hypothetical protein COCON_G00100260 [Conger conger]|uniref:Uncharacterized protein n=1 Tax=Conger conger TaxID=82655 RepID=A0A9Q1DNM2_CONCO|nr:hypothetical protein COCON_G00100260 [Conger conger]